MSLKSKVSLGQYSCMAILFSWRGHMLHSVLLLFHIYILLASWVKKTVARRGMRFSASGVVWPPVKHILNSIRYIFSKYYNLFIFICFVTSFRQRVRVLAKAAHSTWRTSLDAVIASTLICWIFATVKCFHAQNVCRSTAIHRTDKTCFVIPCIYATQSLISMKVR